MLSFDETLLLCSLQLYRILALFIYYFYANIYTDIYFQYGPVTEEERRKLEKQEKKVGNKKSLKKISYKLTLKPYFNNSVFCCCLYSPVGLHRILNCRISGIRLNSLFRIFLLKTSSINKTCLHF